MTALLAAGLALAGLPAEAAPKGEGSRGADVSLSGSLSPTSAITVGQEVTLAFLVRNAGPALAGTVELTDTISGPATVVDSSFACTGTGPVVCRWYGLEPGEEVTLKVRLRATEAGTITSSAGVTVAERDPDPSNNTATNTIEVTPGADLAMASRGTSTGPFTSITHTATNHGPDDAPDVTVLVGAYPTAPASVSTSQGQCAPNSSVKTWTCKLGTLANGQSASVEVLFPSATYAAGAGGLHSPNGVWTEVGTGSSGAEASSPHHDPAQWNNGSGAWSRGTPVGVAVTPCRPPDLVRWNPCYPLGM